MPIFCTHCGHANQADARFCTECGEPILTAPGSVSVADARPQKKKKLNPLVIILPIAAVFLGLILFVSLYILPHILSPNQTEDPTPEVVTESEEPAAVPETRTPDFEAYGIPTDLVQGVAVNYVTCCYQDPTQMTTGVVTVDSYERAPVTEDQIAFGEQNGLDLHGYDRCHVHMTATFGEPAALSNGVSLDLMVTDYYDCAQAKDSQPPLTDTMGREFVQRALTDADGSIRQSYNWLESGTETTEAYVQSGVDWIIYVPSGYDGCVVGFQNGAVPDGYLYENYAPENYHLFRLN